MRSRLRLDTRVFLLLALLATPVLAQDDPADAESADEAPGDTTAPAAAGDSTAAPVATVPVDAAPESPPADRGATRLESLEVTAQRRKQRLIDVPVAVTAITMDQIEARDIARLDDLNSLAPGLQISRSPSNTTISQLTIRGASQINPAIYWDPAVGVYLDGVYIGKGQGAIFDIVDLAGVEVLRGPQGTLYGRNTIGGTINFISREPSGNFGGTLGVEYGTYDNRVYRGALDLPRLGDMFDITIGARSETREPWIETTPTSPVDGMNNRDNHGAHLGAVASFAENLEALYHLDYGRTDQTNNFLQLYRYDNDASMQQYVSRQRRDTADINAPTGEFADVVGHSLIVTWGVADALTVKSISGMRTVKWIDKLDLDGSPRDIAHSERHTDYEQLSQDLNVGGRLGAFNYTAGVYYFADDGFTNNPIFVSINGVPVYFDSRYGTEAEAWAGYGQVDWTPARLERLTLTAGVRHTREKKELDRVFGYTPDPAVGYVYYMPEGYRVPGATFEATTPMAAVAYKFRDWLNGYVRYAEGFKSGGFNGEYSNIQGTPEENQRETSTPFDPELQQSLEAGVKTSFFGGNAVVNLAVFHNKLDDLQVSIFTGSGAAASVIRNAGKATVRGFELETAFVPRQGTTLRANYAFLDPSYDEFVDAGVDQSDNRAFVHAPRHSWNLVADSELWTTRLGTVRATVDYAWTDRFYTYPYQLAREGDPNYNANAQSAPDTEVPAYGLLNAKLALTGIPLGGSRLGEFALWGRNVLDEDSVNNYIDFGPSFNSLTVVNFVEPASFGAAVLLRF